MKDFVEVQLPSGDRPPIVLCVKEPRDCIPPAPFDNLSLYFRNGPAIGNMVGERGRNGYPRFNSRRQLVYRIAHGLTEFFQSLPTHPSV